MNIFTEAEFTLFLKEINKSKMVFKIRDEEIFLCSTLNGYEEEVSICELAKLSEEFLIEKLGIWINSNIAYYDLNKGNKLTLSIAGNKKIKFSSFGVIIAFDEMINLVDIKNRAIIEYAYQAFNFMQ